MTPAQERLVKALDDYIEAKIDERLCATGDEQDVSLAIRLNELREELKTAVSKFFEAGG